MPSKKIKHLDMIEAVIERMAKNSFQLKGWTMTLVTIVGTFSSQSSEKKFIVLAFVPILAFWVLDSFYLQQERKYRLLYKIVRCKKEKQIDFDMDTSNILGTTQETKKICFFRCMFSISEMCFYPFIAIAIILLVIALIFL